MKRLLVLIALIPLLLGAGEAWLPDPYGWERDGEGTYVTRSSGFAWEQGARGRKVVVSALIKPIEAPIGEEWPTVGVALFGGLDEFWHLALVQQPAKKQGRHSFELAMKYAGVWPAQEQLKCRQMQVYGTWEYGKEYRLRLESIDGLSVKGEILEEATGKRLFAAEYACSENRRVEFSRPALHVTGEFRARASEIETSVREPEAMRKESAKETVRTVDEIGTILGVDHCHSRGMFCESLGYSPYGRHVQKVYQSLDQWADETYDRLQSWGFTTLGTGCDIKRLGHRGMPHTVNLNFGTRLCGGDPEWAIMPYKKAPCTAFPNVFHPDFAAACEALVFAANLQSEDDDLIGYYFDNELRWWGAGDRAMGLFDAVKALPESHSARRALELFLAGRKVTPEIKVEFLEMVAERYFGIIASAIRRVDKRHLLLGCRFAGLDGAHETVWTAAGRHCDVVTFNCYPWADIDQGIVYDRKCGTPIRKQLDRMHSVTGRPLLITEWSFPALDTGRPCTYGAGQRFPTQVERVKATELFAREMLACPYVAGYNYFMWVDQPAPGMNKYFPEDSNYGLVQENGEPHQRITEMFTRLQKGGESVRFIQMQANGAWVLSNDAGVELKGRQGPNCEMVESVALNGKTVGSLGGMVEVELETGRTWIALREVKDCKFVKRAGLALLQITAIGDAKEVKLGMTLEIQLTKGERDFAVEIISVTNLCRKRMKMNGLYLRPFAFGKPKEVKMVPNMWREPVGGFWELADGTLYGVVSGVPDVKRFRLWLDEKGNQHPDVIFAPSDIGNILEPKNTYSPPRPLRARVTTNRP